MRSFSCRFLPLAVAGVLLAAGATAFAEEPEHHPAAAQHPAAQAAPRPAPHAAPRAAVHAAARPAPAPARGEPHPGPRVYQRVAAPPGATARPQTVDRA